MNVKNQIHKYVQSNLISFLKSSFLKNQTLKRNVGNFSLNGAFYSNQKPSFSNLTVQYNVAEDNLIKAQLMSGFYGDKFKSYNHDFKDKNNITYYNVSRNKISEPQLSSMLNIKLPLKDLSFEKFYFPSLKKFQITEPVTGIVKREAHRMIIIRRKKMNKHKWKKRQRKMKFFIHQKKKRKEAIKEAALQEKVSLILKEGISYNAESHLNEKISILNWKRPVTKIRNRLAPQSVIKEYLEKDRLKQLLDERVQECLKKQN